VLHSFTGALSDGSSPFAPVVIGSGGVLYGTTSGNGASDGGTVFCLTPPASLGGPWTEDVLYSFTGFSDGYIPIAPVVIGNGGVLCGSNTSGAFGYGTVFSLVPPASPGVPWTENVLYTFTGCSDGRAPEGGLLIGRGGVLYGTTALGGAKSCDGGFGTVFALRP